MSLCGRKRCNMNLELKKASITEKPILANLLELYAYDFTEYCDFDIGDDGFYGYKDLPLYWTDSDKFNAIFYNFSGVIFFK